MLARLQALGPLYSYQPLNPSNSSRFRWRPTRTWLVVLTAYLVVFGSILIVSRGLPYPIDNNESFSSLWHARNLDHVGFAATKGLADEVFSWSRAASPYVHTHQGNFPRVFAYLLFLLGIRTIQGQIITATFTVGLLTLWFAYRFLSRITTPLFATVACLILITDYALFGQWQTNTYRIWYGFFFFSSLLWVRGLGDEGRSRFYFLFGVADFCAMFYGEYVFAGFVGITAGCYGCWCYRHAVRTLVNGLCAIFAGGAIAALVLVCQLVAYMGIGNLRSDIDYTLSARNMAEDHSFAEMVGKFYSQHHVIFWQNYFDTSHLRTLAEVGNSLLNYHLAFYGEWITLIATIVLMAWLTSLLFPEKGLDGHAYEPTERNPFSLTLKAILIGLSAYRFLFILLSQLVWIPLGQLNATRTAPDRVVLTWASVSNATYELDLGINDGPYASLGASSAAVYGVGDLSQSVLYRVRVHSVVDGATSPWQEVIIPLVAGTQNSASDIPSSVLVAFLSGCITLALLNEWSVHRERRQPSWARVLCGSVYLLLTAKLMLSRDSIFGGAVQKNWGAIFGPIVPHWVGPVLCALGILYGLGIILDTSSERTVETRKLSPLIPATICVAVGYLLTYRLFTGYVYSGYLVRQAPFLVFWSDTLLAVAPYMLLVALERTFPAKVAGLRCFIADSVSAFNAPASLSANFFRAAQQLPEQVPFLCALALTFAFAVSWTAIQSTYVALAPPTGYGFLSLLARAPVKGGSIVVNDYPAPMAEMAHSWAYAESSIFSGQVKLGPDGFSVPHDNKYLWFADAETNREYLRPKFGLLVSQPASLGEAMQRRMNRPFLVPPMSIAFSKTGIVERTQNPLQPFLQFHLIGSDSNDFALVQFDWDFPPFLRRINGDPGFLTKTLSVGQKIALNTASRELRRRWRVEVDPSVDLFHPNSSGKGIFLLASTIDGFPIFSDEQLASKGWVRKPIGGSGSILVWKGVAGISERLRATVTGDEPELVFAKGPDAGKVEVEVNDMSGQVDLRQSEVSALKLGFSSDQPHGKGTFVPDFAPGVYVETAVEHDGSGRPEAEVRYRYAQQDGIPEANSIVRVYFAPDGEAFTLVDSFTFVGSAAIPVRMAEFKRLNPDIVERFIREKHSDSFEAWLNAIFDTEPMTRLRPGVISSHVVPSGVADILVRRVPLPHQISGKFQLSVTPASRVKSGPEYFGLPFDASLLEGGGSRNRKVISWNALPAATFADFPYGKVLVSLRFPSNRTLQAEPILSSGVLEAGDFIYVIYDDPKHIRLGFDHWFKGGALSGPIPIDYSIPHQIEISMGSLYPNEDDLMFADLPEKYVSGLKGSVSVKLDGKEVVHELSECYESTPGQVQVGKNQIHGTTSNPLFTGELLDIKRIWPGEN
jgi:hypothetical protein